MKQDVRNAAAIFAVVTVGLTLSTVPAMAHGSHQHADDGLNLGEVFTMAGTAAALGIVYLLVSRVYRYRDTIHHDTDSPDSEPPA